MASAESTGAQGVQGSIESGRDASGAPIVRLVGEIDISNASTLAGTLDRLVAANADDHVVVDLAELEFMDSSGIAMLLQAAGRVGSLELRSPTPTIRRIIESTGLSDVLRMQA